MEVECYHNFRLSIVRSFPGLMPWYYSHFINLTLQADEGELFPIIRFEDHLDVYDGVLEETPSNFSEGDVIGHIRACLLKKRYVIAYLNWKHVESSSFYRRQNMVHEALVYGFDDNSRRLHLLAFQAGGKEYGHITIDYEAFEAVFSRLAEEDWEKQRWFAYYGFPISDVQVTEQSFGFDYRRMFFALDRSKAAADSPAIHPTGAQINRFMADYFRRKHAEGNIPQECFPIWGIMVYKTVLHKTMMLQRLEFLQKDRHGDKLQPVVALYQKAHRQAQHLSWISHRYRRLPDPKELKAVAEAYDNLYAAEKRANLLLMEFLVHRQTYNSQKAFRMEAGYGDR